MRESRTYGSVRGALSNERPYREGLFAAAHEWRLCGYVPFHGESWNVTDLAADHTIKLW